MMVMQNKPKIRVRDLHGEARITKQETWAQYFGGLWAPILAGWLRVKEFFRQTTRVTPADKHEAANDAAWQFGGPAAEAADLLDGDYPAAQSGQDPRPTAAELSTEMFDEEALG